MHDHDEQPRKGENIAIRLIHLAAEALAMADALPRRGAGRHIASQMTRAAASCGANYEEARGFESRRDFIHKLRIAEKELRETRFWLRLSVARWPEHEQAAHRSAAEADELLAIIGASIRTARR